MKQPCVKCKRCDNWFGTYWCKSKRIDGVTGERVFHQCWWYRHTPFCKFKSKENDHD